MKRKLVIMIEHDLRSLWAYEETMQETIDKPEKDREYQTAAGWADLYRSRMQGVIQAAGIYEPAMRNVDPASYRRMIKRKIEKGFSTEEAIVEALGDPASYYNNGCGYYGKPLVED